MVSYKRSSYGSIGTRRVLILIVVEDGLVLGVKTKQKIINNLVLILVVVDDGLVHAWHCGK